MYTESVGVIPPISPTIRADGIGRAREIPQRKISRLTDSVVPSESIRIWSLAHCIHNNVYHRAMLMRITSARPLRASDAGSKDRAEATDIAMQNEHTSHAK